MTKIRLKDIIDELNDVLGMPEHMSVCALMTGEEKKICGWSLAEKYEDGSFREIPETTVHNLKELFDKVNQL